MTLKDIARELNLSVNTISDVLNGGDQRYSAATRQRVHETAARLGYRPNRQAQLLAGGKSGLIGVIKTINLHQPAVEMILYAGERINASGYQSLSCELLSPHDQISRAFQTMIDARVEGVILDGVPDLDKADKGRAELRRLTKAGIPVVCMGGRGIGSVPHIRADAYQAGRLLAAHLLRQHRRFAVMASRRPVCSGSVEERVRGVRDEVTAQGGSADAVRLIEVGLPHSPESPLPDYASRYYEPSRTAMLELLDSGSLPDALICSSDAYAIGALKACAERGVKVPEEIGIAGFDNTALGGYLAPSLTSIAPPSRLIAQRTVEVLLSMIGGKKPLIPPESLLLPCTLHVRESCGVPPL